MDRQEDLVLLLLVFQVFLGIGYLVGGLILPLLFPLPVKPSIDILMMLI